MVSNRSHAIKKVIGIFGGSFNPPHLGHLQLAKEAYTRFSFDEIWFLVNPQNPLKQKEGMESFNERVKQCEILTADYPWCKVSLFEHENNLNITADTLKKLKETFPNTTFVWLMGSENLATFHNWQRYEEILQTTPIITFFREDDAQTYKTCQALENFQQFRCAEDAEIAPAPQWRVVMMKPHKGRATTIRTQLANGKYSEDLTEEQIERIQNTHTFCM